MADRARAGAQTGQELFDVARHGERIALVADGEQVTYRELAARADEVAECCRPRSLAFLLCTNTVASVAGYVGFLARGVVPLLLGADTDRSALEALASRYRPSYVWAPVGDGLVGAGNTLLEWGGYRLVETGLADPPHLHDSLALLVSTSGSTGSPKLVRQSITNLASNAASIADYLGITPQDRAITSLQMNYVYGLSVINSHLHVGATLVLTDLPFYGKAFWRLVREAGATSFAGVPFMYETLDRLGFAKREAPPSLRTMTQAGGRLSPELQERFAVFAREHGIDLVVMYGASEATARMSWLPPERVLDKLGSIGVAIPGGRFEIVGEGVALVEAPGATGELVYYGPNVTLGYATAADDLARGDDNQGRLVTGDVARRDEDGFYYIVGRLKRFVKIVGRSTSLDEVEAIAREAAPGVELACAGLDDLLGVFFVGEADAEGIASHIVERTGINRRMIRVEATTELPRTPTGKLAYERLNDLLRGTEGGL